MEQDRIVMFSDVKDLQNEINCLQEELAGELVRLDHMIFIDARILKTAYLKAFGLLELQLFKQEYLFIKLHRKLQLIIECINHFHNQPKFGEYFRLLQEDIDYPELSCCIEEMEEQIEQTLLHCKTEYLEYRDLEKMERMYKAILKELHTQLHPNAPIKDQLLFLMAMKAYASQDLEGIEDIYQAVIHNLQEPVMSYKEMKEEIERLCQLEEKVRDRIEIQKNSFYWKQQELLKNPDSIDHRKQMLQKEIENKKNLICIYENQIDSYLKQIHARL